MDDRPLRIGTLGAARITPDALVKPARDVAAAQVLAVAARDEDRARAFADRHGIPRVHAGYDDLLADPDVDAVYNPLPNGLHGAWTIRALRAGKHVLCEKPFTANADEAREVAAVARATGLVCTEAFHWRHHPLATRLLEIVRGGELGELRHAEASFCIPIPNRRDIRYDLALAGGATMDLGCYAIHIVRTLVGAQPRVTRARAREWPAGVDRVLDADLRFGDGRTGRVTSSMLSRRLLAIRARAVGSDGSMSVLNPVAPQRFHRLRVRTRSGARTERVTRDPSYRFQLESFVRAVRTGDVGPSTLDDAVANMEVIDACYRAAGLEPRRPTPLGPRG